MPSWKKVITSGSAAELSSLYAPSITGSLLGTASYANNANSASYALTASYAQTANSASYATTATLSERTTQTDILVLNQTGFNIPKGTVVRITGSNNASDIPRINTASYENDNNSANTLGITTQAITNGSQGFVITEGVLLGIDTSNYTSGQLLYLGATGSITGSAPLAPLHTVRLGEVIRQQSNQGSIYVSINNGFELGELHDVRDTTTSSSYGDLLVKSGSIWINSNQLTGSYALTGNLVITGSTSGNLLRITQTGTGNAFVVEDSTNPDSSPFVIDAAGNVGIGTTSPNAKLDISGSANIASGLNNNSARPAVTSGTLSGGEIRSYSNIGALADDGFLRLSAGGGTNAIQKTYIDITGFSNVTDMKNNIVFGTAGVEKMRLTEAGRVGIGKTSPSVTLDVSGSVLVTGSFNASSYPNKLIALTQISNNTLISHSVGTTNFTAINLNSDGTNRYAKASFVAPLSGQVQITMEFDMIIVNSAAVQMIGLHNTSSATSTPSEGWYRINADNDATSGQFYANFIETGLTPGVTYNYYFMGVCDFSGNLIRASAIQTGSYVASSDLPSPLRIYVYDLGPLAITSNPST